MHKSSAYNWSFAKIKWLKKKIKKIFNYKTAFVVVVLGVAGQIHATKTRKDETRQFVLEKINKFVEHAFSDDLQSKLSIYID